MDERRAADGVEHLQSAARELLGAARAFLDVVEDVVEDPDRLSGAAATVTDLVRGLTGRGAQPWEHSAWTSEGDDDREPGGTAWWDEPYEDEDEYEDATSQAEGATDEAPEAGSRDDAAEGTPPADGTTEDGPAEAAPAKKASVKKASVKKRPAKKAAARTSPAKEASTGTAPASAPAPSRDGAPDEPAAEASEAPAPGSAPAKRPTSRVRRISVD